MIKETKYLLIAFITLKLCCCDTINSVKTFANSDSLFVITENNLWGYMDPQGRVVIPPQYLHAESFENGIAEITDINNKHGVIDSTGQMVIEPEYDQLYTLRYSDTLFVAKKAGKLGIINSRGKIIAPFQIDIIYNSWITGKTYCKIGKEYKLLDENGQLDYAKYNTEEDAKNTLYTLLPDTNIYDYNDNRARIQINSIEQNGFMNKQKSWVIPLQYKRAENFSEGLAAVSPDGHNWFYIDTTGKKIIPGPYRQATSFIDGVACVNKDSLINKKGELISVSEFQVVEYFPDYKIFRVEIVDFNFDGLGYISKEGKIIVNPRLYDEAGTPSEGLIPVCQYDEKSPDDLSNIHERKWGFVDIEGKEITPIIYSEVLRFSHGLAAVQKDGKWGFIDKTGKTIIPFEYDNAFNFDRGLARVTKNGKMEYIDMTGKIIWQEK